MSDVANRGTDAKRGRPKGAPSDRESEYLKLKLLVGKEEGGDLRYDQLPGSSLTKNINEIDLCCSEVMQEVSRAKLKPSLKGLVVVTVRSSSRVELPGERANDVAMLVRRVAAQLVDSTTFPSQDQAARGHREIHNKTFEVIINWTNLEEGLPGTGNFEAPAKVTWASKPDTLSAMSRINVHTTTNAQTFPLEEARLPSLSPAERESQIVAEIREHLENHSERRGVFSRSLLAVIENQEPISTLLARSPVAQENGELIAILEKADKLIRLYRKENHPRTDEVQQVSEELSQINYSKADRELRDRVVDTFKSLLASADAKVCLDGIEMTDIDCVDNGKGSRGAFRFRGHGDKQPHRKVFWPQLTIVAKP